MNANKNEKTAGGGTETQIIRIQVPTGANTSTCTHIITSPSIVHRADTIPKLKKGTEKPISRCARTKKSVIVGRGTVCA